MTYNPLYYYEKFMEWIGTHYYLTGGQQDYILLTFDPYLNRWYEYTAKGYYEERTRADITEIYNRAMQELEIASSTQQKNHCLSYLEVACQFKGPWLDNSKIYDCVKNGIVDLRDHTLMPHHPKWHFKHRIERNFLPEVSPIIPEKFNLCLEAIPDKFDRENYLKFWLAAIHKKHEYEVFLLCYGVKWGGKSSNLNIFAKMFGDEACSKKPLAGIGKRFGLASIYDKRINIHPDMPIVPLDPWTISILKTLTGQDGMVEVEFKGQTPFNYEIQLFLAFGINQLMMFNQHAEKEIDSVMRRVVLVEFPTIQNVDETFKQSLLDPDFLDTLYSWLMITTPLPLIESGREEQEAWIARNKRKWLLNADPVLRILMENYEFKENCTMLATEVVTKVEAELQAEGQYVPRNLKGQITNAFGTMKIYPNNKRGTNAMYLNCSSIYEEDEESFLSKITVEGKPLEFDDL